MSQKDVIITKYKIIEKQPVTHDTSRFRFALPPNIDFKFLPGDHVKIYPNPQNPLEFKPYTPTTIPDIKGYFELIIKHYPNGKVSGYMKERGLGDEIGMSGPDKGGHFEDGMAKRVGMVAGGTGITPMISMIRSILSRRLEVDIFLLFANKSVDDIILKDEFDKYADKYDNFDRFYILDKGPEGWQMGEGRITKDLMNEKLFGPSDDTVIFVCGPPMMQINLKKQLLELGHQSEKVIFP
ncbi:MAG: cytochrome-b5 reductase [Candidatus Zixiibacteriota bacterium]|nr:MAG: cytochrome-b5 reductase [candidate division Zixibacteria bacterium]